VIQSNHLRVTRRLVLIQALLGLGAYGVLALRTCAAPTAWIACGEISVIFWSATTSACSTRFARALSWRSGNYPILVLGDKHVWHASWIRKALSAPIGFLLERGKLNPIGSRICKLLAARAKNFS